MKKALKSPLLMKLPLTVWRRLCSRQILKNKLGGDFMGCFVWRVPLPEDFFNNGMSKFGFVRDELLNKKILRQGWGIEDLRKGESP